MYNKVRLLSLFLVINVFCFSQTEQKIIVGAGPEDFVLDTFAHQERLIISCDPRREKDSVLEGDIWSYDLKLKKTTVLTRVNEPTTISFNPHGIYLLKEEDSVYLFVVNHYDNHKSSEIIRYSLESNILSFQKRFPYNSTINSVLAISKNEFYITNDRRFKGSLVHFKEKQYTKVDDNILYPNGINIKDSILYVSTTISNNIYAYKIGKNSKLQVIKRISGIKGADNIRFYENLLLTTSHPKLMRVVKHYKNSSKHSPSIVYSIDLTTYEKKVLFMDDGNKINAASTALIYKNELYISQIFENFILKIPYTKNSK